MMMLFQFHGQPPTSPAPSAPAPTRSRNDTIGYLLNIPNRAAEDGVSLALSIQAI